MRKEGKAQALDPTQWILLFTTGSQTLLLFGEFHPSQHSWPCHLNFSGAVQRDSPVSEPFCIPLHNRPSGTFS